MNLLPLAVALPLVAAAPAVARAASGPPGAGAWARPVASDTTACKTGTISHIFIDNHSIFDTSDPSLSSRFSWAYHAANALHVRTRAAVIRRELLFDVGDCYSPFLAAESARLLRAYDFISKADVYGIRQPDGHYHVIVDTQDEWSTTVDLRLALDNGLQFRGGRLREANLLGTGQSLGLYYIEHDVTRDYGVAYSTPQLFGTRWDFDLAAGRTRSGNSVSEAVEYPFLGEAGRWAARESYLREDRLFDYVLPASDRHVLAPVRNENFDLAAVTRLGRRGNLTLIGGGLAVRRRSYPGRVQTALDGHFDERTTADSTLSLPVASQLNPLDDVRMVVLLGQRHIRWVQRRGLDALRGRQDVRLGAEVGLSLARSIPTFSEDDDFFTTLTVYTAFEAGDVLVAARGRAGGRRNLDAPTDQQEWQDIFGKGEVLAYWRPAALPNQTFVARAEGAGGWNTRVPFQLTLGGDEALRGYEPERFPGGRRLVFSGEDRIYFGWPFPDVFDLGGTLFMDVGRIWPGGVPFGEDSGWRASAGFGLRGSFPAGGRTTYRADVAFPLEPGGLNRARFIISVGELLGLSAPARDTQRERSRAGGISGDLFTFPH